MQKKSVRTAVGTKQAFKKGLGKNSFRQVVVPQKIKYGASVIEFMRKLDAAYEISQRSELVFK